MQESIKNWKNIRISIFEAKFDISVILAGKNAVLKSFWQKN
jgi:hypothetical protein